MGSETFLKKIPVLRILVPFVVGILLHDLWHNWFFPIALIIIAVIALLWLRTHSRDPHERLRWRPYFILPLAITALALGWLAAVTHCPPHLNDSQCTDRTLTGRVTGIDYTDFSMRLTIEVLDKDLPPCKVLVSTRGCDYTMRAGDVITWKAVLSEVGAMGNPGEMDYAGYLLHSEGIRYQQHLPASQIKKTGYSPTLITRLACVRRELQLMVYCSTLAGRQ